MAQRKLNIRDRPNVNRAIIRHRSVSQLSLYAVGTGTDAAGMDMDQNGATGLASDVRSKVDPVKECSVIESQQLGSVGLTFGRDEPNFMLPIMLESDGALQCNVVSGE